MAMQRFYLPTWLSLTWMPKFIDLAPNFVLPAGKRYGINNILVQGTTRDQHIAKGATACGQLNNPEYAAASPALRFKTVRSKGNGYLANHGATGPLAQGMTPQNLINAGNAIELGQIIWLEIEEGDLYLSSDTAAYRTIFTRLKERIQDFYNENGLQIWCIGNYGSLKMYVPNPPPAGTGGAFNATRTEMLNRYANQAAARAGIPYYTTGLDEIHDCNVTYYPKNSSEKEKGFTFAHSIEINRIANPAKKCMGFVWNCIEWVGPGPNQLQNNHYGWWHRVSNGWVKVYEHSMCNFHELYFVAWASFWYGDGLVPWSQFPPRSESNPNAWPFQGERAPTSEWFPDVPGTPAPWSDNDTFPIFPFVGFDFMHAAVAHYAAVSAWSEGGTKAYMAIKVNDGAYTTPKVGELLWAGNELRGVAACRTLNDNVTVWYYNPFAQAHDVVNVTVKHPVTNKEWTFECRGNEFVLFNDTKIIPTP